MTIRGLERVIAALDVFIWACVLCMAAGVGYCLATEEWFGAAVFAVQLAWQTWQWRPWKLAYWKRLEGLDHVRRDDHYYRRDR